MRSEHNLLVEGCKNCDRRSQKLLYDQYSKAMYNICCRMLNNRTEAEDLLQDTFMDVYKNIDRFEYQSTIGAWIKRITINNCINFLKKRRLDLKEMTETTDCADTMIDESEYDQYSVNKIMKGMTQLPEGYRVVLNLFLLEGYDHQEISEILGISVGTSKSQLNRAKSKLRSIVLKA